MRYTDKNGQLMEVSEADLKAMDQREGRVRVPSAVVEASIGLCGALLIVEQNTDMIAQTARRCGCYSALRTSAGMLRRAINLLLGRISARQNLTIRENSRNLSVQISVRPTPMTYNIPVNDLLTLAAYALEHCRGQCMMSAAEARRCPLRAVLSTVPRIDYDDDGIGLCPYMGAAVQKEEA